MKASRITQRNEIRIRVDFPYSNDLVLRLKQIPDTRWSKTIGAWHIPYTKEAFAQLKALFPDVEYKNATQANKTTELISRNTNKPIVDLNVLVRKTSKRLR